MNAMRSSPLHDRLERLQPTWDELNGMPIATQLGASGGSAVELADLSALERTGLKGPGAADWLRSKHLPMPERPNAWSPLDAGILARLGRGEFLIEDAPGGSTAATVRAGLSSFAAAGVYPVLRQDAALLVRGKRVRELLVQVCNIDFSATSPQERAVTLTMMAGVSVTILQPHLDDVTCYRIWCDGTFAAYLWDTLSEIASELGGGPVGLAAVLPNPTVAQR